MDFFSIVELFGGLAFFLFGMDVMGKSLEKQAGGKLKNLLEKLTANKVLGVLLGMGVTAVIQSSSATTVMVVGFVNSGIMKLTQAIEVIMGANIGTTITAWLLSLTGLEGDSFIVQLFKPTTFAPILALIGVIMILFCKKIRQKDTGTVMLGFAVLMSGMEIMSNAVEPLGEMEAFTNILLLFKNPVLGVLAGAVLTAVIQSSSASVGILQALSMTGGITYSAAIPIIMGQNIGTCVTALISSIGTNRQARRVAAVHLYFNLIGTTFYLIVFYALNAIFRFSFVNLPIDVTGIAVVHSIFNLATTALLLPFTKQLEWLACQTIRGEDSKDEIRPLDKRFLTTPSVAISQCRVMTENMAAVSHDSLRNAIDMLHNYNEKTAQNIQEDEDKLDKYEDQLGSYLVELSSKSLSREDSQQTSLLLHVIGDFERIGDHGVNLLETSKELWEKGLSFSEDARKELDQMGNAVREVLQLATDAFRDGDMEKAKRVEPLEETINELRQRLKRRHVERLRQGACTIELGFIFSDVLADYERVAAHCSNIAADVLQIKDNKLDTHEYLEDMRTTHNEEYLQIYQEYQAKYQV